MARYVSLCGSRLSVVQLQGGDCCVPEFSGVSRIAEPALCDSGWKARRSLKWLSGTFGLGCGKERPHRIPRLFSFKENTNVQISLSLSLSLPAGQRRRAVTPSPRAVAGLGSVPGSRVAPLAGALSRPRPFWWGVERKSSAQQRQHSMASLHVQKQGSTLDGKRQYLPSSV